MVAVGTLAIVVTKETAVGVVVAESTVLIGSAANTSVSLAFDWIFDSRLDIPWKTYLNGFSMQCMVSAVSMKIEKVGSCGCCTLLIKMED